MTTRTLKYDFVFLVVTMLAIILSFSQFGVDDFVYDNKIVPALGKFSLNIYLVNYPISTLLKHIIPEAQNHICIYIGLCVFAAYLCMVLSDFIRNKYLKIKSYSKILFFE